MELINTKRENGKVIKEYSRDGKTISATVVEWEDIPLSNETEPTIYEKILIENQYQTALIEMQTMGGM
ncbi:hypothetical protein [Sporosarcina sp. P17b]|uniref:hypothetical protein n=1 Tax=Sporosarcina sp. P17b TaxID=2048260 RepID=UPI000C1684DB|nr:hypothetical protein [Sporosarcina sp. P17b]PIC70806.1 hypothetical protein CSV76_16945 [Sporosarcina sp. P17b]